MVGESFHPRGCWGEDSDHIRLGATAQKPSRLFAYNKASRCWGEICFPFCAGREFASLLWVKEVSPPVGEEIFPPVGEGGFPSLWEGLGEGLRRISSFCFWR